MQSPTERGLILSQRNKTHLLPGSSNRNPSQREAGYLKRSEEIHTSVPVGSKS